jgi:hypothetical protein
MIDSRLADEISLIESLSKLFAVSLGVLYLLGFLVVASYLSQYGVSSFSVLHLQYLIAGIWVLGPPVVHACLTNASRRFEERAAPDSNVKGIFNWRRFAMSTTLTAIPVSLFMVLLVVIPHVLDGMTWGIGIRLLVFYVAMVNVAQFLWMSWRADTAKETWLLNRTHAAPFYLTLLLMIVVSYAVWFSVRIYPLIPFSMGGGRPLTVVFIEGEKRMPDEIQRENPSAKRSIPYKLLISTEKYYVVASPSPKERSLEISRDAVAGIVVLE